MGCVSSRSGDEEERKINQRIEKSLREAKKENEFTIKLLLLGAGESGKSTFAKQMKILFLEGYNQKELAFHKDIIHSNIIQGMRSLITEARKRGTEFEVASEDDLELLMDEDLARVPHIDYEVKEALKAVWEDPATKKIFHKRNEVNVTEAVGIFLDDIERIAEDGYVPTVDDVLQSRARTIGVKEMVFKHKHHQWRLVDVGGQRNERKKWIHCFDDVTAVVFFVDTSAYNLSLVEDPRVNRLTESLALFEEICNCKYFDEVPLILFLNKSDLLVDKIKEVNVSDYFEEFTGGQDFDKVKKWMQKKFVSLNHNPDKVIFPYWTCATDTKNIQFTFEAVQELVIYEVLEKQNLI